MMAEYLVVRGVHWGGTPRKPGAKFFAPSKDPHILKLTACNAIKLVVEARAKKGTRKNVSTEFNPNNPNGISG